MSARTEPWIDELESQLAVAAVHVTGRLRTRRRTRRMTSLAIAALLVVGGAALAETTPFRSLASFHDLLGAQRETTAADALPPAMRAQFARSHIAGLKVDQFRLMAKLPGGRRIYAAPRDDGLLCVLVTLAKDGGVTACGPRLGPTIPLTAIESTAHAGAGTVLAGLARDDVRSILITVGGVPKRIAVKNNAFFYEGAPFSHIAYSFVVELRDGGAITYPTR